jgi:dTDP-D-glucose 4,6-dehydratase
MRYALSDAKLRALGWAPTVDFNSGLASVVEQSMAQAAE